LKKCDRGNWTAWLHLNLSSSEEESDEPVQFRMMIIHTGTKAHRYKCICSGAHRPAASARSAQCGVSDLAVARYSVARWRRQVPRNVKNEGNPTVRGATVNYWHIGLRGSANRMGKPQWKLLPTQFLFIDMSYHFWQSSMCIRFHSLSAWNYSKFQEAVIYFCILWLSWRCNDGIEWRVSVVQWRWNHECNDILLIIQRLWGTIK
jgi:hypothetical protein